jgi:uncharacterized RDD family membrane protein YckC
MSLIEIATPFNIDIEFEAAPFFKRYFAYMIDFILLWVYLYVMCNVLFGTMNFEMADVGFIIIVIFFPMLLYTFTCELLFNGQTLGKKIFGIRVVSLEGGEATLGQYLIRWFARFYEWGFIVFAIFWGNPYKGLFVLAAGGITSIIIIAVTSKSQRLGDILAGTAVVNTKSKLTVHDTIFMNIAQQDYKVSFPQALRLSDRDINTIKNVITQTQKHNNHDMCNRVADKVKTVLNISTDMYSIDFLEKIISDYNYLATRE